MADQMINGLPVKTAPQTGDKLLIIGTAEEQLIDYDKLADAILNKLTSKSFTLDQGTMTLLAALNALNSKTKTFGIYSRLDFVIKGIGLTEKEYTSSEFLKALPVNSFVVFTNSTAVNESIKDMPEDYGVVICIKGNTGNYCSMIFLSSKDAGGIYRYKQDNDVNENDKWVKFTSAPFN